MAVATSGTHDITDAGPHMRRAALASMAVAAILVMAKLIGYGLTGSVAMLASLLDSALDGVASLINFLAVRQALTPPDHEHRFGHGKAEALAGLVQAALIAGSATFLTLESAERLIAAEPVSQGLIGVGIIVGSLVLTFALVTYQRRVARRTGSLAIKADSAHYASDFLMNAGVIASLILAGPFGLARADGVLGLAIAGYIAYSAYGIFREAYNQLMDRELPDEERARIKEIALGHPDVISLHDLRTRASGLDVFIQLHLDLDRALPLHRAHAIGDEVEARIRDVFPNAEVLIHHDPVRRAQSVDVS